MKVYQDRMQKMSMIYLMWNDVRSLLLLFELKSMHMYNIENVYMVNKQVNDNILYMRDNEVRDPSVQLYLFLDK
jgi:hypothetical protein